MTQIMIIEDDPAIRDELALLLENEGYQPLLALLLVFTAVQVSDFLRQRPTSGNWRPFWTAWTENTCSQSVPRRPRASMSGGCLT